MKKNEEDEGKKEEEEFISNVGRKEQDHQGLSSSTSMMSGDKKMIGGGGSPRPSCSFHNPNIPKPQDLFNMFVNNMNQPFEHVWLQRSADGTRVIHPLENLCEADFIDRNIGSIKPINPLPMENTPFVLVEDVKELKQLAAKLNSVEEFAVDLEHNQYRSFQGMTCLMQISTRTEDFVVDTLKLRVHVGPYLREIFKDPSKRKVMHGADRDIVWLQRDFGIYVCNLFDTQQASRVLDMERNSLEYLLLYFCGVAVNKAYQIADWRVRPLPDDMLKYAREDTHYLLFLYDLMRRRLLSTSMSSKVGNDLLSEVYKRSYDVCMQLYEKELLTDTSFLHIYGLQEAGFNSLQLSVVSALCEWRDNVARVEDESTGYILPNKTLLEIARQVPLTVSNLRRLVKSKHPYVEFNLDSIVDLIKGSIRNAAAFEPTAQLLKERRLETVTGQNIEVVSTLPFQQHVIDDGEVVNRGNEQTTRRSPATDEGIADSATAFYGATEEILNKASNDVGLGKSSSKSEIDADPKVIEQHIELDPTVTWQHERIDAGVGVNIVSGQNTKRYSASVHVKNEVVTARSIEVNSIVSLQSQKIDDGESVNVNGQKTLSASGEEHPKLEREMLEHSRSSQGSSFQPLGEAEERIERECHVLDLETGSFTILRQMRGTFSDKGNTDSAKAPSGATEGALDKPSHDSEVAISMPGLKFDAGSNGKVEQMESLDVIPFQSFISNNEQLKDREILYPQNSIGKPTGITKLEEAGSLKTCFADQEPLYNMPTEVNNGFTEKSKLDALIETISLSNLSSKLQKCFQLKLEKKNTYEKKELGCGSQLGAFDYSKKRMSLRHGQEEEMLREGDEGFKSLLDSREGSKSSVIRRFRTDELTRRFQQERQYQTLLRAGNQI